MILLGERGGDPLLYQQMEQNLGLDGPLIKQYFSFLFQAFQGDLGQSIITKQSILYEFFERFPATLELGLSSLLIAIILGVPFGIIAAVKKNTYIDYLLMGGSLVGYSMPIFWWGLILILFFSIQLGLTPVSGRIAVIYDIPTWSGFMLIDTLRPEVIRYEGLSAFSSAIKHLILPSIAMSTIPLAIITRMTRSSMLDVLREDYIRTAHAKGLHPIRVICLHALKNAFIPIITVIGLLFGSLITGAILTETIFSWPGVGRWFVNSINSRDYPAIQGGVLIIASMIVILNGLIDVIYTLLNPRLKE